MRFLPVNDVAAAILPRARPSVDLAILISQSRTLAGPASMQQPRPADRRSVTVIISWRPPSTRTRIRTPGCSAPLGRGDACAPVGGRQTGPRRFRAGFLESANAHIYALL